MMVDGELLTSSGAKRDLKTPVHSSRVQEILAKDCRRSIQTIELPEIRSGEKELAYKIQKSEADILIMDAICEADIDRVAKACVTADIPVVCVDPGCFTVRMAQRKFVEKTCQKSSGGGQSFRSDAKADRLSGRADRAVYLPGAGQASFEGI